MTAGLIYIVWTLEGIFVDFLPLGHTITGKYNAKLIPTLCAAVEKKRQEKLKGTIIIHQDNIPVHKTCVSIAAIHKGLSSFLTPLFRWSGPLWLSIISQMKTTPSWNPLFWWLIRNDGRERVAWRSNNRFFFQRNSSELCIKPKSFWIVCFFV